MLLQFVKDNLLLFAVAVTSGAMLIWPMLRRPGGGPAASTLQTTQMINRQDAVVVDVREDAEYAKGHVMGARHIPLAQLGARAGELQKFKSRPLIAYCETGTRSGQAVSLLRKQGFEQVFNLTGGFAAWQQAGLPVEK
ncbi:MAG TPA: rhodanese-like domain-containing protein [Burkholderiales bacterium]|nr:rhodanese-like domain-containing protein [Burkholderiales bacterium]